MKSNDLKAVAGEIGSDSDEISDDSAVPVEYMKREDFVVQDGTREVRDTLVNIRTENVPKVIIEGVDDADITRGENLEWKMNENERMGVRDQIQKKLKSYRAKGLREVVQILCQCMPIGIRKPKKCETDMSRTINMAEESDFDKEMLIEYWFQGIRCKIFVTEDGVKLYVNFGPKFVLHAE